MSRNKLNFDKYVKLAGLIVPIFIAICINPFENDIRYFVKDLISRPKPNYTHSLKENMYDPTTIESTPQSMLINIPIFSDLQCEETSILENTLHPKSNYNLQKYLRYNKLKREIESLKEKSNKLCESIKEINTEEIKQRCYSEWKNHEKCYIHGRLLTKLEFQHEISEKNQKRVYIETEIKNRIEELEKL